MKLNAVTWSPIWCNAWLVLVLVLGSATPVGAQQPGKETPSPVTLVEVSRETLRQQVQLSGNSVPWRSVLLSPRVDGLVSQISVDQGNWVKPGDPVVELDGRLADIEIDIAQARVAGTRAKQRDAQRKRDELTRLKKNRHASETAIESAIAELEIANADLTREQAELSRARELRKRHTVTAPFAGMVVDKHVEAGQWVQRADTLVELVEMDTLRVEAPLPQRYYALVEVGAEARVRFDALSQREFIGKVFARVAKGNAASRSFPLLIDLDNSEHLLAPGMSARVQVDLLGDREDALVVPRDAVVAKSDGSQRVWRVREEQGALKAYPVDVETGRATGALLEVTSGSLQVGDRLVMLGNESLRPGQSVREQNTNPAVAKE